jgi:hypothetical protein
MMGMAKASEWAGRVAAWRSSGQKAAEFCSGHGYSPQSLLWWSSHFRRNGTPPSRSGQVRLARVVRTPAVVESSRTPAIIVHMGQARVEVPAGADPEALPAVLRALASVCTGGGR